MKITKIKIDGYKNLIDVEYNLENFNVIIGANNSGKSNLLEIFSFINVLLTGSEDIKENLLKRGELDNKVVLTHCKAIDKDTISLEIEFNDYIEEETYKFSYYIEVVIGKRLSNYNGYINKEVFKYKKINSTGPMSFIFERDKTDVKKVKGSKIQNIDESEAFLSLVNKIKDIKNNFEKPVQKGIDDIFLLCKTPVLYSSPDIIREFLQTKGAVIKNGRIIALALYDEIEKILNSQKAQYYKEILEDILDVKDVIILNYELASNYKNFVFNSNKDVKNIALVFKNGQTLEINELSDGTLIIINLITYLVLNKYPVLAIEELENSIHPKLLKKMINLLKNDFYETQIIITTHSPVLLNLVKHDEVSIISIDDNGIATIEQIKNKKELIKRLSGPFSNFSDIFFYTDTKEQ